MGAILICLLGLAHISCTPKDGPYQDAANQRNLQCSRQDMKDHRRQEEADTLGTPVQSSGQPSRLAGQMEIEVELQQMFKDTTRDPSYRLLSHTGKHSIPQFLKQGCTHSRHTVYPKGSVCLYCAAETKSSLHAIIMLPATVVAVPPTATKSMFMASTILLK